MTRYDVSKGGARWRSFEGVWAFGGHHADPTPLQPSMFERLRLKCPAAEQEAGRRRAPERVDALEKFQPEFRRLLPGVGERHLRVIAEDHPPSRSVFDRVSHLELPQARRLHSDAETPRPDTRRSNRHSRGLRLELRPEQIRRRQPTIKGAIGGGQDSLQTRAQACKRPLVYIQILRSIL